MKKRPKKGNKARTKLHIMSLYKGVFWAVEDKLICKKIKCAANGNVLDESTVLTAKNGKNDNHKKVWNTLCRVDTNGKLYNYYPRGRVEICHEKALVFLNPLLCIQEFESKVIHEFGLTDENGIKCVVFKADGSKHYQSHFDV